MDQFIDWVYSQLVGFFGNFFAEMGNMGVELFEMSWVQSIVLFFSYLAWTLYVVGLVVAVFEVGIEYQTGRASIKDAAISAVKGFMAVGCFTLVPVELYKLSVTLQASLTSGITGYPRVSDQTDDLLIEVAGRPGVVGGNMTLILLAAVERFSPEAYLTACKRAVETGDSWRVQTLVKESEGRLSEPLPSLHGEVILYAYTNNCRNIAKDLIAQCTPEQIASVPPKLLRWVAEKLDFQTAVDLVDKGVRPGDEVAGILRTLTGQHQEWMAERLLEHGMPVEPDNYDALYACVSNQAVGAAKLLLDRGIDLEQYQLWAEHRPKGDGYTETMEELAAYWSELQNSTQPEDSPMKGMNL